MLNVLSLYALTAALSLYGITSGIVEWPMIMYFTGSFSLL